MISLLLSVALAGDLCDDTTSARESGETLAALAEGPRDDRAIGEAMGLERRGGVCTPTDQVNLGLVYLASGNPDLVESAMNMATAGMSAGVPRSHWLYAHARDRWMVLSGKRQQFGTSRMPDGTGRMCMVELDNTGTDELRAKYKLPSLEEQIADTLKDAGVTGKEPTIDNLRRLGLLCPPSNNYASKAPKEVKSNVKEVKSNDDYKVVSKDDGSEGKSTGAASAGSPNGHTIHPGELYGHQAGWVGTAYTAPKGITFHPLLRSSIGLTDFLDVKTSFLGWIAGANAGFEISPNFSDTHKLSFEAYGRRSWNGNNLLGSAGIRYTNSMDAGDLTISVTGGYSSVTGEIVSTTSGSGTEAETTTTSFTTETPILRPEVNFGLRLNDKSLLVFSARTGVIAIVDGLPNAVVGTYFVTGAQKIRFSGGLNITYADIGGLIDVESVPGVEPEDLPGVIVLPLPHLQLWWKF